MRICAYFLLALAMTTAAARAAEPVSVMIVGTYHMSNPGHDIHNLKADDVLAPSRQQELVSVAAALARFKPTQIDVEWSSDIAAQRYRSYLGGTLAPSRNEVVQLGFRLAKETGLSTVHGIDVDGDFPYEAVQAFARAHGEDAVLADANGGTQKLIDKLADVLAHGTVAQALRFINDPARIATDNSFYRNMLKVGSGTQQPGADLLTAWYRRNFYICANLTQLAKPGDRVVVFYGFGHAFLLRQCVAESPGMKLIEPNDYLPN